MQPLNRDQQIPIYLCAFFSSSSYASLSTVKGERWFFMPVPSFSKLYLEGIPYIYVCVGVCVLECHHHTSGVVPSWWQINTRGEKDDYRRRKHNTESSRIRTRRIQWFVAISCTAACSVQKKVVVFSWFERAYSSRSFEKRVEKLSLYKRKKKNHHVAHWADVQMTVADIMHSH